VDDQVAVDVGRSKNFHPRMLPFLQKPKAKLAGPQQRITVLRPLRSAGTASFEPAQTPI